MQFAYFAILVCLMRRQHVLSIALVKPRYGWILLVPCLILASCSKMNWQQPFGGKSLVAGDSQTEVVANQPSVSSASIETGPEGLMRAPAMPDVRFTGLAGGDLRQHSAPSEGTDFDPDVDAAGQSLAFASTRHSKYSHLYIKSVTGATLTQITDGPFNDTQPCFDPTGQRLAFASDRGGNWDIWVIDIDGRNPIQITRTPAAELHPSWSPDGSRLAYCRIDAAGDRNTIWLADLQQPGLKKLVGEGSFPAWSPQGDKLAFQRARARGSRWFSIWTIDLNLDEALYPTEIASQNNAALISPSWSPDGQFLTFSIVAEDSAKIVPNAEIGLIGVDGLGMRRLSTGEGDKYSPVWGGDGRIYFSNRTTAAETIWSVKPHLGGSFQSSPSAVSPQTRRAVLLEDKDVDE